jgi:hypothetical protein
MARKSKVNPPLDVRVRDRIERFFEGRIKAPEYIPLAPFFAESERIYRARKEEQLKLLDDWDSQKKVKRAIAEVASERAARETAERNADDLKGQLDEATKAGMALKAFADEFLQAAEAVLSTLVTLLRRLNVENPPDIQVAPDQARLIVLLPSGRYCLAPSAETDARRVTALGHATGWICKAAEELLGIHSDAKAFVRAKPPESDLKIDWQRATQGVYRIARGEGSNEDRKYLDRSYEREAGIEAHDNPDAREFLSTITAYYEMPSVAAVELKGPTKS